MGSAWQLVWTELIQKLTFIPVTVPIVFVAKLRIVRVCQSKTRELSEMGKKDKDSVLDDYEKLETELTREKVKEIFHSHPKDHIAKLEAHWACVVSNFISPEFADNNLRRFEYNFQNCPTQLSSKEHMAEPTALRLLCLCLMTV